MLRRRIMRLSTRPWATAGVALAGASLIAATPVARAVPDIQTEITTPQLDLGGLFSPAGSFFNALGFDFEDPAMMVGPIASILETGQAIAQSIGWDDVGNQPFNLASLF
jgi:hypothetical protein